MMSWLHMRLESVPRVPPFPLTLPSQVRAAAWLHMRLGGVEFLPVDRSRLMGLLVNWSAFPHIMVRVVGRWGLASHHDVWGEGSTKRG